MVNKPLFEEGKKLSNRQDKAGKK